MQQKLPKIELQLLDEICRGCSFTQFSVNKLSYLLVYKSSNSGPESRQLIQYRRVRNCFTQSTSNALWCCHCVLNMRMLIVC